MTSHALFVSKSSFRTLLSAALMAMALSSAHPSGFEAALAEPSLGLYAAGDFRLTTGQCRDCPTIPQAIWYFRDQLVAVPAQGVPAAGYTPGLTAHDDLAAIGASPDGDPRPPLIWLIPTDPRPFPDSLRDKDTIAQDRPAAAPAPVAGVAGFLCLGLGMAGLRVLRRRAAPRFG